MTILLKKLEAYNFSINGEGNVKLIFHSEANYEFVLYIEGFKVASRQPDSDNFVLYDEDFWTENFASRLSNLIEKLNFVNKSAWSSTPLIEAP